MPSSRALPSIPCELTGGEPEGIYIRKRRLQPEMVRSRRFLFLKRGERVYPPPPIVISLSYAYLDSRFPTAYQVDACRQRYSAHAIHTSHLRARCGEYLTWYALIFIEDYLVAFYSDTRQTACGDTLDAVGYHIQTLCAECEVAAHVVGHGAHLSLDGRGEGGYTIPHI